MMRLPLPQLLPPPLTVVLNSKKTMNKAKVQALASGQSRA